MAFLNLCKVRNQTLTSRIECKQLLLGQIEFDCENGCERLSRVSLLPT